MRAWEECVIFLKEYADLRVKICGNYKVTVNAALDIDQYPMPKPDDFLLH